MAVKKKSTGTGTATEKSKKIPDDAAAARNRKIVLFFVLLVVLLALITGLIWLGLEIPNILFKDNRRFVLKRLEVTSSGYWHGRDREIAEHIGVNIGKSLFDINAGEVRKKVLAVPNTSIDSCEVQVVLPDTLVLKLTERVPRAALYPQTQWVVDEFGELFPRKESSAAKRALPVLYDLRAEPLQTQAKPALALIMTTIKDYPDIAIRSISLKNPHYLRVILVYRERERYTVKFPIREDYRFLLNTLQSTILKNDTGKRVIDLQYQGKVIIP
jgi:cell division septal protein FtsQ